MIFCSIKTSAKIEDRFVSSAFITLHPDHPSLVQHSFAEFHTGVRVQEMPVRIAVISVCLPDTGTKQNNKNYDQLAQHYLTPQRLTSLRLPINLTDSMRLTSSQFLSELEVYLIQIATKIKGYIITIVSVWLHANQPAFVQDTWAMIHASSRFQEMPLKITVFSMSSR